ncbi:hypothetical protein A2U01_0091924, partial [Trifolium medium]|nr:hypothetical protein [Trifolium medium]
RTHNNLTQNTRSQNQKIRSWKHTGAQVVESHNWNREAGGLPLQTDGGVPTLNRRRLLVASRIPRESIAPLQVSD